MTTIQGLVILDPPLPGARNMQIDEALLQNAKPDWPIVLRIYRWQEPTLSLGHFQQVDERESLSGLTELPWVRRRTGGGAIVHDQELTYSIVIPNRERKPTKGHNEMLYRAIHLQFVLALCNLGLDAKLSETCTCRLNREQKTEPFLCFSRRSPVDLIVGVDKIMGSAQRRSSKGLLQHGSFLMRRSESTPHLPGLLDLASSLTPRTSLTEWESFLVATLKSGVDQLLQVQWRNGNLCEVS